MSVGSQTTHAMTRANLAGAEDAKRKLQEIAARDLGGAPDDYALGGERVYRSGNPGRGLTYAQAAARAIALGGRFDGHELPDDIHAVTKAAAARLAGLGPDGRGEGRVSARRRHLRRSSPASPKWKSTSRPAWSRSSTSCRSAMSARW